MTMKQCTKCQQFKLVTEFNVRNQRSGQKYYAHCKECRHAWYMQHADLNPKIREKMRAYNRQRKKEWRKNINEYLSDHPCVDCGETDIAVLEFDHVSGEKERHISFTTRWVWERVLKEIEKCEVRCANCHMKRHSRLREQHQEMEAVAQVVRA